eukprot:9500928-Pyramimonas_sp.AAC.3
MPSFDFVKWRWLPLDAGDPRLHVPSYWLVFRVPGQTPAPPPGADGNDSESGPSVTVPWSAPSTFTLPSDFDDMDVEDSDGLEGPE